MPKLMNKVPKKLCFHGHINVLVLVIELLRFLQGTKHLKDYLGKFEIDRTILKTLN